MDDTTAMLDFGGSLLADPDPLVLYDLPDFAGSCGSADDSDTAARSLTSVDARSESPEPFLPFTQMEKAHTMTMTTATPPPASEPQIKMEKPLAPAALMTLPVLPEVSSTASDEKGSPQHAYNTRHRGEKTSKGKKGVKRPGSKMSMLSSDIELDEDDSEDLNHLDKRERNKRSAAKYRKRRKMYVATLERKISQFEDHVEEQSCTISALQAENRQIREQLQYLQSLVSSTRSAMPTAAADVKKASVFMLALFSCFLLTSPLWHADTHTHDAFDPSVSGYRGRVLLSIQEEFGCSCACSPPASAAHTSSNSTAALAASGWSATAAAAAAAAATTAAVQMPTVLATAASA